MSEAPALARVVNKDRMRVAIQRANVRRVLPTPHVFTFGKSRQTTCCHRCGDVIREGDEFALNETTGRAHCAAKCWTARA